jgi:pimeloyl-ACP methyl ester carboxylesterase
MPTMSSGTAALATTDLGQGGPALLCVPGWCGDRSVFDPIAALAARHRRVVTVDLPDHGGSPRQDEVSTLDVVDGLVETIARLELDQVVPVTLSHAGWVAVELRRRLGPVRVPAVVLLDWMVLGTPPGFDDALDGLRSPAWREVRDGLLGMWTDGLEVPALRRYVDSMGRYGARHWQRAGREIADAFTAAPVPLEAIDALQPCPTLHLYAQPADDQVLAAQQDYAATHPWFAVRRLDARSHFPMFEVPETMTAEIEAFIEDRA